MMQFVHLLCSSFVFDPIVMGAKIDGAYVVYMGDSFGGIQGVVVVSIELNVQVWILNVVGGGVV